MIDVAIIDYNTSNLHSVQAACRKARLSSEITSDYSQIICYMRFVTCDMKI